MASVELAAGRVCERLLRALDHSTSGFPPQAAGGIAGVHVALEDADEEQVVTQHDELAKFVVKC